MLYHLAGTGGWGSAKASEHPYTLRHTVFHPVYIQGLNPVSAYCMATFFFFLRWWDRGGSLADNLKFPRLVEESTRLTFIGSIV